MRDPQIWPADHTAACAVTINLDGEFRWEEQYPSLENKDIVPLRVMAKNSMEQGVPRILATLNKYHVKATFFISKKILLRYSKVIQQIIDQGHEIASFSNGSENLALLDPKEQKKLMANSKDALEQKIGRAIKGFRAPDGELTQITLEIAEEEGFKYSSNLFSDNRPFLYSLPSEQSILEIPSSWALCDLPYFIANLTPSEPSGQCRIPNYDKVLNNWKWECIGSIQEKGCCVLQFNSQTIASLGRIYLLDKFLEFILEKQELWIATCEEISDYLLGG